MCISNHFPEVKFSLAAFCAPKGEDCGCIDPAFVGWVVREMRI